MTAVTVVTARTADDWLAWLAEHAQSGAKLKPEDYRADFLADHPTDVTGDPTC